MFIARVSRGRTVREFVFCVLWMAVFGSVAIDQVLSDPAASTVKANVIAAYKPELSLFAILEGFPDAAIT